MAFVSIIRRLTSPYRRSGNLLRKQESHRQRDKNPHQKKKNCEGTFQKTLGKEADKRNDQVARLDVIISLVFSI